MTQYNPNYYQSSLQTGTRSTTTNLVSRSAVNFGGMGAIVGGAVAAAQVIPMVKNKDITAGEATREVLKEAAGAGVATAAGAAVAGSVFMGGFASLVAMFGVATGVKYLWNLAFSAAPAEAPLEEPAPEKAKATKTAAAKK